jgi:hypothetical protein
VRAATDRDEALEFALFTDLRMGSTYTDADLRIHYSTPGWTSYEGWRTEVQALIPGADGPAVVISATWITGGDETDNEVWIVDGNTRGESSNLDWPFLGPDARDSGYDNNPIPSDVGDLDGDGYNALVLTASDAIIDLYYGPIISSAGERPADVRYGGSRSPLSIAVLSTHADLDGDGRDEWLPSVYDGTQETEKLYRVAWQDGSIHSSFDDPLVTGGELTGTGFSRFGTPIDIDGDGKLDLALGDSQHQETLRSQGAVHLLYGPFDGERELRQAGDATILGVNAYDGIGYELATGDFNGDGFGDVAVGNLFGAATDHPGVLGIFMGGPR